MGLSIDTQVRVFIVNPFSYGLSFRTGNSFKCSLKISEVNQRKCILGDTLWLIVFLSSDQSQTITEGMRLQAIEDEARETRKRIEG